MPDCALAGAPAIPPCGGGKPQNHHYLSKQRIKRRFPRGAYFDAGELAWLPVGKIPPEPWATTRSLRQLLDDRRNLTYWLCFDHHQMVEHHNIYLPVPAVVIEFAKELKMDGDLERDEMRRVRPRA